ncbi:MAG TPA: hypothetical protein VFI17_08555 [Solirubrobacterales bacterium]|nr:hypothetical protein [Solirubrobacterales bacterium]
MGLALERAVAEAFDMPGWSVERQPVLGGAQPDLLVSAPGGKHFVVEIKVTTTPIHFGIIAQIAAYSAFARSTRDLREVQSVLLTTAPLTAAAKNAAHQVGVLVLDADLEEDTDPASLAHHWARTLAMEANPPRDQTSALSEEQQAALIQAASEFNWSRDDLLSLLRAVVAEDVGPAPRRTPLRSVNDWARLFEAAKGAGEGSR